jgi:hypothetical protein
LTILCPFCREKFKSFQKFKKLTKTLYHEHTHAIKKKLLSRVGESFGGRQGEERGDVISILKELLKMSRLVFMVVVKRDVLANHLIRARLRKKSPVMGYGGRSGLTQKVDEPAECGDLWLPD